jgi:FAD/FMN-containing dehydrogenase
VNADLEIWNAAVSARPAMVRRCADVSQVREAIGEARSSGLPLSVLGGGHDWAGRAVRDGGMVIDLRGMRGVKVDGDVATVGGGATAADVIAAAAATGQSAVTGTAGAVGMAGLTLGGGYGPVSGVAGLAADNMLSAEVVLADGTVVAASGDGDPDLLWALRGGGGNFGVVTSMRVLLHNIPRIWKGTFLFPVEQGTEVLSGYGELVADAPDALTAAAAVISAPDGMPVVLVSPVWGGDPGEGAHWVKRFESLGTPVMAASGLLEYGDLLRLADEKFGRDGRHYAIRTRNLAAMTAETLAAVLAAGSARTSPHSAVNLHHFHGVAARVPLTATAFGIRREHFMTEIIASWQPDGDDTRHRSWADDAADRLLPHALPGGYPNLLTAAYPEQVAHAYGPNAARLIALKDTYDPGRVFTATPLPPTGPA